MSARPRICIVGSLNMDLVVRAPRLPAPGETVLGGPFDTFPGGKGANQAVAAARAGARVAMIGAVGADEFGATLRAELALAGVDAHIDLRADAATGVALITVDATGENTIVVAPGANGTVDVELLHAHEAAIRDADALVCQLEVPLDAVMRAAELARAHGTQVVVNAAPACSLPESLLRSIDVLVVNRGEAVAVSGVDADAPFEALGRELAGRGPRVTVITRGRDGAVAFDGRGTHVQTAFAVDAIDAVAAGDAFVGALATELAAGRATPDALRFACAAGALATTKRGAQPSLPTRDEIAAFLALHQTG